MDGSGADPSDVAGGARGPAAPPPSAPHRGPGRKKGTACARCRSQKIRCDDETPCTNCARVGQLCVRNNFPNQQDALNHIARIETRLRCLEDSLSRVAPEELEKAPPLSNASYRPNNVPAERSIINETQPLETPWSAPPQRPPEPAAIDPLLAHGGDVDHGAYQAQPTPSSNATSLSPGSSTQIGPSEPLAHEVGMLSLANSKDSKYVGPSSGVPFARLIFSAIPQSQGLATNWATPGGSSSATKSAQTQPFPQEWTSEVDLQHFVDAYFETYQPFYPFLDEDAIAERLELLYTKPDPVVRSLHMPKLAEVEATLAPAHVVQMFLIIALGARILEVRLSAEFSAERYLATAMQRIGSLALHDSIEGLQIMLLLALCSFYFEDGPNAWFLTSNLIASCLDLGFQRKWNIPSNADDRHNSQLQVSNDLRRGIFWSTYSLERTLAVVLGRPLTLRDEAIDVEFPGDVNPGSHPTPTTAQTNLHQGQTPERQSKRARFPDSPYVVSQYSFRFDQITAEIKLMLYRVNNLPHRFPWPMDLDVWKKEIDSHCNMLLDSLRSDLKRRSRRNMLDGAIRTLELKYHHCRQLLHRPSPAILRPGIDSWKTCCNSAVATILLNSELHRFSKLSNSWLTAHTVFVSGITFLYCLWVKPEIKEETSLEYFTSIADACTSLLQYLAKTWSVAADAVVKFERLINLTTMSWRSAQESRSSELVAGHSLLSMSQSAGMHTSRPNLSDMPDGIDLDGLDVNVGMEQCDFEPGYFFNELGDMSTWFDLNWLTNPTLEGPPDATYPP